MAQPSVKVYIDPATGQQFTKTTMLTPVGDVAPGTQTTQVVHSTDVIPSVVHPVVVGQSQPIIHHGDAPYIPGRSRRDRYFDDQRHRMDHNRSRSRSSSPPGFRKASTYHGPTTVNKTVNKNQISLFRSRYQLNAKAKATVNKKGKKSPVSKKGKKTHPSSSVAKTSTHPEASKESAIDSSDEDLSDQFVDNSSNENEGDFVGTSLPKRKKERKSQRKNRRNPQRESLIGPHIQGDEHTVTVFKQIRHELRFHTQADNAPRAFKNAILVVGKDFDDVATPDESFTVHKILLESYHSGSPIALQIASGEQTKTVVSRVGPSLHENMVAVDFAFNEEEPFFVLNRETVSISLENENLASEPHGDIFEMDSRVFSQQEASVFNVPMSLYNESLQHLYKKHRIPTPIAVLTVQKERDPNSFSVRNIQVFLNMKPSSIPGAHLQISGFPSTSGVHDPRHTLAVTAIPQENNTEKRIIHEALKKAFFEKNPDIALASSAETQIKDPESFVHWGEMTGSLVAYTVIQLLMLNKDINRLNDPLFLSKILSVDKIGSEAVKEIIDIKSKLGISSTDGESSEMHLFPSLLQLLSHTSGLQNASQFTYEHALQMYEDVINSLRATVNPQPASSSEEPESSEEATPSPVETTPNSVYDNIERQFVESLKTIHAPLNPENAVIGDWRNSTEACLVAMFLTRYAQHNRFPEEIINASISRLSVSIQLKWGLSLDTTGRRVESPNNPYNLTSGASSRRVDLVTFVKKLSEELSTKAATDSPFAVQLANPIKSKGIPGHNHIAWREDIVGSSSLLYMGTTEVGIQGVIAFLVPDLDFWGVVVDTGSAAHKDSVLDQGEILDLLRETLYNVLKDNKITGQSSFHRANFLDNSRYVRTVTEIEVMDSPKIEEIVVMSATYLSPFSDITARNVVELKFEPLPEFPTSRLRLNVTANASQSASTDVILDHKRNGFFVIRPDGSVGEEVIITADYVSLPGDEIFIRDSILLPKLKEYQGLVKEVKEKAKNDIFGGPLSTVNKVFTPVTPLDVVTKPEPLPRDTSAFEGTQIGAHFGAFLGGAAVGGLAAAGALALTRPYRNPYWYGPYSPYGMYPATPFASGTVWYGPGSPYGDYPPDLWFGTGSPYGLYPPVGLPSYVRWYGSGSRWGMRRPIYNRGYYPSRWGPRWGGPSHGYVRGGISVGGHRDGGGGGRTGGHHGR